MRTVTLKISDSYFDKFMGLIDMLPKKAVRIEESEKAQKDSISSLGGALSRYADESKRALEEKAWEMHTTDKYK